MKISKQFTVAGMLAAFVLVISGCSDLEHVKTKDLSVSTISNSGTEKSLDELIGAWEDTTGEMCELSEASLRNVEAIDGVSCDESSSVLYLYPSTSVLKSDLNDSNQATNTHKFGMSAELVGPNWRIDLGEKRHWEVPIPADEVYKNLEQELGGVLVQIGDWSDREL